VARVSSPRVCLYPVLSDCFWATIVLTARPAEDIYFLVVGSRTELSLCVMVDIYEFLIFGDVSVWHTASAVLFVSAFLFFGEVATGCYELTELNQLWCKDKSHDYFVLKYHFQGIEIDKFTSRPTAVFPKQVLPTMLSGLKHEGAPKG
jgi:hypothetical protein